MARYHITEDGPKKCSARIKCPLSEAAEKEGRKVEHFNNKTEATAHYEKVLASNNESLTTISSVSTRLAKEKPTTIDKELAQLYGQYIDAKSKVYSAMGSIKKYSRFIEENKHRLDERNTKRYLDIIESLRKTVDEQEKVAGKFNKEMVPYNKEFDRRGGWTRAFLVSNGNGHVHKSMECSTCFPTTKYNWMTEYSGKDEKEIVEDAGERACTICYPSAPVDVLNRKTKMFTDDEKRAEEKRLEREAIRKTKAEEKKRKGITAPDGGPLIVKTSRSRWGNEVKTERSAQIMAVNALVNKKLYKTWDDEGREYNSKVKGYADEELEILIPALALKRNQTEEEVLSDLDKRAEQKFKREYSA